MEWVLGLVCLGLIGMLIYQHIFYAGLIKALVDRLMAGTLREFEQSKNPTPPRVVIKHEPPSEDLNRILG